MKVLLTLSSVMALAIVLPAQGSLLPNLEAQYTFEGGGPGDRFDDKSGNGVDLTVRSRINVSDGSGNLFVGNPGQAAGYSHSATPAQNFAKLEAVSGGNFNRASQLDPIAVEFSFKPVSGGVVGDMLYYGAGANEAFGFSYPGGRHLTVHWAGDEAGGGDTFVTGQTSTYEVANGEWSRARFVYDGATVQAWLNADQIVNQAWPHGIRNPTLSATNPLQMFESAGQLGHYNGQLDEVEISTGIIPEPASAMLLLVGSGLLLRMRRYRVIK